MTSGSFCGDDTDERLRFCGSRALEGAAAALELLELLLTIGSTPEPLKGTDAAAYEPRPERTAPVIATSPAIVGIEFVGLGLLA